MPEDSPALGRDQKEEGRSQGSGFGQGKSNAALMIADKLRATADRMHEVGMDMVRYREYPFYDHGREMVNAAATAHSWARKVEEDRDA